MRQYGWILAAALALGAVPALAGSITGATGNRPSITGGGGPSLTGAQRRNGGAHRYGPTIGIFKRTIGGRQVREGYLLLNRSGDDRRRGKKRYPGCRTGLHGRIVNKPCLADLGKRSPMNRY